MRTRAKAITVATAMVATFALLPALGASAAEPLADGTYEILIEDTSYTLEVVDGVPAVPDPTVIEFDFAFDDDSRVLDEFEVTVGDATYLVEIAEDGTVEVTAAEDEDPTEDEDATEDGAETSLDDGDELDDTVIVDEDDLDEDEEVEATATDSPLVATVAACAPRGWEAAEAGLPTHGFFVSHTARGEQVDFEVDGETYTADLTTSEGVSTFCALADDLIEAADLEPRGNRAGGDDTPDDDTPDDDTPDDDTPDDEGTSAVDDLDDEGTEQSEELDDHGDDTDEGAEDDDASEDGADDPDAEDDADDADASGDDADGEDEASDDVTEGDDDTAGPADRSDRGASQRGA